MSIKSICRNKIFYLIFKNTSFAILDEHAIFLIVNNTDADDTAELEEELR